MLATHQLRVTRSLVRASPPPMPPPSPPSPRLELGPLEPALEHALQSAQSCAQSWYECYEEAHTAQGATCSPLTRDPTPSLLQSFREPTPSLSISDLYAAFANLSPLPSWLPAAMHYPRDARIPRATRGHVNVTFVLSKKQIVFSSPAQARLEGAHVRTTLRRWVWGAGFESYLTVRSGGSHRFVVSALQSTRRTDKCWWFGPVVNVDVPIRVAARLFNDLQHALSANIT